MIYVMRGHDKYYIGRTTNIVKRFNDHKNGRGAKWTQAHQMTGIIDLAPEVSKYQELVTTLKYMEDHGIDNVRGGPWCRVVLKKEDVKAIENIIHSESFNRSDQDEYMDEDDMAEAPMAPLATMAPEAPGINILAAAAGSLPGIDVGPAKSNNGRRWTDYDEFAMFEAFRNKIPLDTVARRLGRTEGAIKSRTSLCVYNKLNMGLPIAMIQEETNLVRADIDLCAMRQMPILNAYWK
jgi:hypothetical protein